MNTENTIAHFALLEDDIAQADIVKIWLEDAGHKIEHYEKGRDLMRVRDLSRFSVFLLDWELPDIDGFSVLKWLRDQGNHSPVLFFTTRDHPDDIVSALSHGADDYLVKPLNHAVTLARIQAALRRRPDDTRQQQGKQKAGEIEWDNQFEQIWLSGELLKMTHKEFQLAACLLENEGRVVSREAVLKQIWGMNEQVVTRTVDTHISRIKKKLKLIPEAGWQLTSIYQHGYRLNRLSNGGE